jgi:hypothetical protein
MIQADRFLFRRPIFLAGLLLALSLLGGCGKKAYPVKGQVVYEDGAAANDLAGCYIMLESEDRKVSASGVIGPDGSFTVGTFQEGDGALLGKQRVAITPPIAEVHKPRPPAPIAAKYNSFDTSMLEIDIKAQTNEVTVKVERMKK